MGYKKKPNFSESRIACFRFSLGGGEFGDVCKGRLRLQNGTDVTVAIKTLKPGTSDKNRADFLTEVWLRDFLVTSK